MSPAALVFIALTLSASTFLSGAAEDVLVIENGSGTLKVGWRSDTEPKIAPNFIGKLGKWGTIYPTLHGTINDDFRFGLRYQEEAWEAALMSTLGTTMKGQKVMLTTSSIQNSRTNVAVENSIRKMGARDLFMAEDAWLAAEAHGLTTALVLQAGFGVNTAAAVYDYEARKYAESTYSGHQLTLDLMDEGVAGTYEEVDEFKAKSCYVALDFEEEERKNGKGKVEFAVPERLFSRSSDSKYPRYKTLPELVKDVIERSPSMVQRELWANVVIAGGSTLFPGFKERLQKELSSLTEYPVNIHAGDDRWKTVWYGAKKISNYL